MSLHEQIQQSVLSVIHDLDVSGVIAISPTTIAERVYTLYAKDNESPFIRYASLEHFKQITRKTLAGKYQPDSIGSDAYQGDMFSGHLQDRYPVQVPKGADPIYKTRETLTREELDWNINQLRKSAESRLRHAEALQAYRDDRFASAA